MSNNLYERMLDTYLATSDLTFRTSKLKQIGERSTLVKKGIVSGPIDLLYRYDAVRFDAVKRLEIKNSLFEDKKVQRTLKKCGFSGPVEFIETAKERFKDDNYPFSIKEMFDETLRSTRDCNFGGVKEDEVDGAITPKTAVTLIKTFRK